MARDDRSEWLEIKEKLPMKNPVLIAYEESLTQPNTNLCTISPLQNRLRVFVEGKVVNKVLMDEPYQLEGIDEATVKVITYYKLK